MYAKLYSFQTRCFVWKLQNFDELQLPYNSIFFAKKILHVSYLPMSTKGCEGFVLFYLDLELFAKIKKIWFLHTRFLHFY